MLSGIKTVKLAGKRKDPAVVANNTSSEREEKQQPLDQQSASTRISSVTNNGGFSTTIISKETNAAAAQELRKALISGLVPITTTKPGKATVLPNQSSLNTSELVDPHTERLLQRFPIIFHEADEEGYAFHPDLPVTIIRSPSTAASNHATNNSTTELEQLRKEERTQLCSMDEIYARNIARLGSRYKDTDFSGTLETEQEIGENNNCSNMFTSASSSKRSKTTPDNNTRNNSFDKNHLKSRPNTSRDCWWWCQSSSFHKHMLLAIGEHVSLVLAPSYASLVEGHCYLVPNQPAESFVSCSNSRQLL